MTKSELEALAKELTAENEALKADILRLTAENEALNAKITNIGNQKPVRRAAILVPAV